MKTVFNMTIRYPILPLLIECVAALRECAAHPELVDRAESVIRRVPIEPPPLLRPAHGCPICGTQRRARRPERWARCEHTPCGVPFPTRSPAARFCSPSCRIGAMRARKRATHFGAK